MTEIAAPARLASGGRSAALDLGGGDLLTLLVPALYFVRGHFVGQVYAPEAMLAVLLPPLLVARRPGLRSLVPRTFVVLTLVWLYGQIATDIYRATTLHNLALGWANVTFSLVDLAAIALLLDGRPKRYVLFAAGLSIGFLLDFAINRDYQGDPWKFGLATPVAILLVLLACTRPVRRVPFFPAVIFAAGAAVNLQRDYRSLALIFFLGAVALLLADWLRARRALELGTLLRLTAATVLGGLAFSSLYAYAARSGDLGVAAQQKYVIESRSQYGIIGGARPEFLASVHAIADSPLLGHGSWPVDPKYLIYLRQAGESSFNAWTQAGLIPAHSYLTGGWVSAGILAVPIWLWVFALLLRAVVRGVGANYRLLPLVVFAAMWLAWAIPFSPYAGPTRFTSGFFVLLLLFGLGRSGSAAEAR